VKINTVKSCCRCLYPEDHPLGIVIDSEGVCSGCRIHEEKDTLDWNSRWKMLQDIASQYKSKNPSNCTSRKRETRAKSSLGNV
jgi:hypothetical protein